MMQTEERPAALLIAWLREAGRCSGRSADGAEADCPYEAGGSVLRDVWLTGFDEGRQQRYDAGGP